MMLALTREQRRTGMENDLRLAYADRQELLWCKDQAELVMFNLDQRIKQLEEALK